MVRPLRRLDDVLSRTTARALVAGAAAAAVTLSAPAEAGLLDEPPKLVAFRLDDTPATRLPWLAQFHDASIERPGPVRRYLSGPWGRWGQEPWWRLNWLGGSEPPGSTPSLGGAEPSPNPLGGIAGASRITLAPPRALRVEAAPDPAWLASLLDPAYVGPHLETTGVSFVSNGFNAVWSLPPVKPVVDWRCRRRPVTFVRFGGEKDSFPLVRCDGSVAPEALDRLTLIARLPEASRPGELLPEEPDDEVAEKGEWVEGVRVVHPRLLWALQKIADAFPWRTIYVFSGYRPRKPDAKTGTHHSMHGDGRAMDILVQGVPNAELFLYCRKLDDVGCGYYPNSKFVHVDVRRPGTGHAFWIDVSGPGERSKYVDSWPGVVEKGGLAWLGKNDNTALGGSSESPPGSSQR